MAGDRPLEERIGEIVQEAVGDALAPFLRRLGDPEPLVYSVREASTVLGTSSHTIRRMIDQGVLRVVPNMGERRLIPRRDIEALVASASNTPASSDGSS